MSDIYKYWLAATIALTVHAFLSDENVGYTLLGSIFSLTIFLIADGIYHLFKKNTNKENHHVNR